MQKYVYILNCYFTTTNVLHKNVAHKMRFYVQNQSTEVHYCEVGDILYMIYGLQYFNDKKISKGGSAFVWFNSLCSQ